jgi:hypothetical protein
VSKPKLVAKFETLAGESWRVYHARRKEHPEIFRFEGKTHVGLAFFKGPRKNKIYVDSSQSEPEILNITIHELLHVLWREYGLLDIVEEPIVDQTATGLAFILEQL